MLGKLTAFELMLFVQEAVAPVLAPSEILLAGSGRDPGRGWGCASLWFSAVFSSLTVRRCSVARWLSVVIRVQ